MSNENQKKPGMLFSKMGIGLKDNIESENTRKNTVENTASKNDKSGLNSQIGSSNSLNGNDDKKSGLFEKMGIGGADLSDSDNSSYAANNSTVETSTEIQCNKNQQGFMKSEGFSNNDLTGDYKGTVTSSTPAVIVSVDRTVEKLVEVPVAKIVEVEKLVEKPVHVFEDRIVEVEKIVEKLAEVPVELIIEVEKLVEVPVDRPVTVEKIFEKVVEVPVE